MACDGVRRKAWMILRIGAALWLLGGDLEVARAAEKETRVFSIKIDDKPAGYHQMTISHPDDHTTSVDSRADVSVSYLIKKYKYTYRGTERWLDGRLIHLTSETNDDGRRYQVLVQTNGDKLRVRVNGEEHTTPQDVQKRLVRQASLDDGHRVLLELARIDRQALLPKP